LFFTGTADLLIRMSKGVLSKRSSETVRNHRNAVRNASEWLSAMDRNLQAEALSGLSRMGICSVGDAPFLLASVAGAAWPTHG
jgi:hypothetical protein